MKITYDNYSPGQFRVTGTREELRTLQQIPGYNFVAQDPYNLAMTSGQPVFPASPRIARFLYNRYNATFTPQAQKWYKEQIDLRERATHIATQSHPHETLRPYQLAGVKFLQVQGRVLLADEMGTGKTVQALFAVRNLLALPHKRVLVLTLKNLIPQWIAETVKWLGSDIPVVSLQKSQKRKERYVELQNFAGLVFMNHEALPTIPDIGQVTWDWIIVDEAHLYKNRRAQRTKVLQQLSRQVPNITLMTGTPLEKAPHDLWALLNILYPQQFRSYWAFFNTFVDFTVGFAGIEINGAKNTDILHDLIKPLYLRRLRTEVLPDVKEPIVQVVPVEMTPPHRAFYKTIEKETYLESLDLEIANTITRLIRLRQICIDPRLLDPGVEKGTKIDAIKGIVEDTDERVIVFTSFRDGVKYIAEALGEQAVIFLSGDTSNEVLVSFNSGVGPRVLVTTPFSLGLGQNLQAASVVIFADLPWSHTQYVQAVSRIVRIGQKSVPLVYIMTYLDSVDEYVSALITSKQETFSEVVVARSILDKLGATHGREQ